MKIAMEIALSKSIVECQHVRSKQIFRLVFFFCYNSIEKRTIKKDYITDRTYNCIWIYFEMYSFIHSMFRRFFLFEFRFILSRSSWKIKWISLSHLLSLDTDSRCILFYFFVYYYYHFLHFALTEQILRKSIRWMYVVNVQSDEMDNLHSIMFCLFPVKYMLLTQQIITTTTKTIFLIIIKVHTYTNMHVYMDEKKKIGGPICLKCSQQWINFNFAEISITLFKSIYQVAHQYIATKQTSWKIIKSGFC